jgi:hypothetical protein
MILQDTALAILRGDVGATYNDRIEAYQFMNDNFLLDQLTPVQAAEYNTLVEGGVINTVPFVGVEE